MNIEDVQPWVATLLAGQADLAEVPILQDDGTYPKTPGREAALTGKGLVLVVWQIESDHLVDQTPKGAAIESVLVPVVIEENLAVNRAPGGTGVPAMKALRLVREALVGRRSEPSTILVPADPPFRNFGTVNGVHRIAVFFAVDLDIPAKPPAPPP